MKYETYTKYKPSGVEWIGKIPEEWQINKFKFLYRSNMGQTIITLDLVDDGKYPVLSATEDSKYFGKIDNPNFILNKGDLVIPARGNSIGFVKKVYEKCVSTQTTIYSKKVDKKIDTKFIHYYLLSCRKYLFPFTATAIPQITVDEVKENPTIVPTIEDQKKIADFLDKKTKQLDDLVKKDKQLIELLKEKRIALINKVVTKGLDDSAKLVDSGVEWIGKIPENWGVHRLKFVGQSIIGLTYSPDDVTDERGLLVLRSSNVQNNKILLNDNVYVGKEVPNKLITREGDILICTRNGSRRLIGKSAYISKENEGHTFGVFMSIFRSEHWRFIAHVFNSDIFMSQAGLYLTSTINQLTINNLNNIVIALPPKDEQELVVNYLNQETGKIDKYTKKIINRIKLLEEYKKSLIYNAITGKIKV